MSDRSDRLQKVRQQAKQRANSEQAEQSDSDETSKQSKPSKPSETDEDDESDETSVKDERVGTYMYLPEEQKKRIQREYNRAKADYEYEFEDELEKNRHWYPLVAEYGLDGLSDLEPSDIRDELSEQGWL